LINVKIVVLAPMPSASEMTMTAVRAGFLVAERIANQMSRNTAIPPREHLRLDNPPPSGQQTIYHDTWERTRCKCAASWDGTIAPGRRMTASGMLVAETGQPKCRVKRG
jgi:hypothetical protein